MVGNCQFVFISIGIYFSLAIIIEIIVIIDITICGLQNDAACFSVSAVVFIHSDNIAIVGNAISSSIDVLSLSCCFLGTQASL